MQQGAQGYAYIGGKGREHLTSQQLRMDDGRVFLLAAQVRCWTAIDMWAHGLGGTGCEFRSGGSGDSELRSSRAA